MTKLSRWGRATSDSAEADRGRLKDFSFFNGKEKAASLAGGEAQEALLLLRAFEASCHGWFWAVDRDGCLTYISECVAQSLGAAPERLLGAPFADVFAQADDDVTRRRTLPFLLARQSPFEKVTLCPANSRDERYWAVFGTPQFDGSGRFSGFRGSAIDITEQRRSSEHATQIAKYDPLTGLANRRRMAEVLDG